MHRDTHTHTLSLGQITIEVFSAQVKQRLQAAERN